MPFTGGADAAPPVDNGVAAHQERRVEVILGGAQTLMFLCLTETSEANILSLFKRC